VLRVGEDPLRRRAFHDLTAIHNRDVVGDGLNDGEIVGDEYVGQTEAALQIAKQLQHLGLN
jgi:hypothetical protein